MSDHLWLDLPRGVPLEPGFGLTHVPGQVAAHLSGDCDLEPVTGAACPRVSFGAVAEWAGGANLQAVSPYLKPLGGPVAGLAHTGSAAYAATSATSYGRGEGVLFGFQLYGGAAPVALSFGGRFTLAMDYGRAALYEDDRLRAQGDLWPADTWDRELHLVHVYCVGERLVVRRWGGGEYLTCWAPDGGWPPQALSSGKLRFAGTGFGFWFAVAEAHATTMWFEHAPITMLRASTAAPERQLLVCRSAWDSPSLSVRTPAGIEITGTTPRQQFGYRVEATLPLSTGPNLYVLGVRVRFAPVYGSNQQTATDLLADGAVTVPAESGVRETLALDPRQHRLEFALDGSVDDLATWRRANLLGRWSPGGTARCTFLTSDFAWEQRKRDRARLRLSGESPLKSLRHAQWTGGRSYAGWTLAAAYADVLQQAGVSAYSIAAGGYTLPAGDHQDGFNFRPEQTCEDVLRYLHDQFGSAQLLRYDGNGRLVIEDPPTEVAATFVWATPATEVPAVTSGTSTLLRILDWREQVTETGYANLVVIVGCSPGGTPLAATACDWAGVQSFGEFRRLIVVDPGLTSQPVVNWVCRQVYERVRHLPQTARFRSLWCADLRPGDLVEVDGRDEQWRIRSMVTAWDRRGRAGLTEYEVTADV